MDRFKQVNDTFGHPTGDKVLRRFAQVLEDAVADCGIVGRGGGDEFAVMISRELERAELEKMLSRFLRDITEISPDISVGSSIGAYHFLFPHSWGYRSGYVMCEYCHCARATTRIVKNEQ